MTLKQKGVLCIFSPILLIVVVMMLYAGANIMIRSVGGGTSMIAFVSLLNIILSLGGLLGVLAFMIGLPLGIYFLVKKDHPLEDLKKKDAYKNLNDEQIKYVQGLSLGAFLFTPIWAGFNRLWGLFVLSFVPLVSIFVWVDLIVEGKRRAWEKAFAQGKSFDEFMSRQKKILIGAVIFVVLIFALSVFAELVAPKESLYPYPQPSSSSYRLQGDTDVLPGRTGGFIKKENLPDSSNVYGIGE